MTPKLQFPQRYHLELHGEDSSFAAHASLEAAPRPHIIGGPPPEFGGSEHWWSPEHLLLSATALCFYTTFRALAERKKLNVLAFDCDVRGTLDKTSLGLAFTSIELSPRIIVAPSDRALCYELADAAERHCIVANALRCPVKIEPTVLTGSDQHALDAGF